MNYYISLPAQEDSGGQKNPNQQSIPIDSETIKMQIEAQTRNTHALARINEGIILLNGLAEIRMALNIPSVAEDDTGNGERPALRPMFEPEQIAILQKSYLSMSERYHRFAHHMMKHELCIGKIEDEPKTREE